MRNLPQEINELTAALEEIGTPLNRFERMRKAALISDIRLREYALLQIEFANCTAAP
jgi:hypothetical protein